MSETNDIKPVDANLVKEVQSYVDFMAKHGTAKQKQQFATISNPSTRSVMPVGVNYGQAGFIGTSLLPPVIAAPDGTETASYPTFSKDRFYTGDTDIVGFGGTVPKADMSVSWSSVTLDAHAQKAPVDVRIERSLAAAGIDAAAQYLEVARGQVEGRKEKAIASLLTTTATYSSSTYYGTLSGTTQWSHASATPLVEISTRKEVCRAANGTPPNTFWIGAAAFEVVKRHSTILDLIKYTAGPNAPANLTAEAFAAIIGMNVVIGGAVQTTTLTASLSDIWSDYAGLIYVGANDLMSPKFGCTLTTAGSPKVMPPYFDRELGVEGSNVYTYVDYYKPVCMNNVGGYLWTDTIA